MTRTRSFLAATCLVPLLALTNCGNSGAPANGYAAGAGAASGGSVAAGGASAAGTGANPGSAGTPPVGSAGSGVGGALGGAGADNAGGTAGSAMAGAGGNNAGASAGGSSGSAGANSGGSAGSSAGAGGSAGMPSGCMGGACLNPECKPLTTAAAIDAYPATGFDEKPSYIPNDVIIPTLDDVPDDVDTSVAKKPGNWTTADLAWLDAHNMHWDLFINTSNACDLTQSPPPAACEAAVLDALKLHHPANHTVHHYELGNATQCPDATCVTNELKGVETFINTVSKGAVPHLTRFRAPFGIPFQDATPGAVLTMVEKAVVPFAVQVGWNLDSNDSNFDDGTNCTDANGVVTKVCPTGASVAATVEGLIKTPGKGSAYGIVLMHGIFGWTHDALPLLFDPSTGYLAKNKFRVGTVEDAICWKYGKHSWEIIAAKTGQPRTPN